MPAFILGLVFIVFGAVSIVDAQRIAATIRKRGTLDVIGPDGYLAGTAVLLIVIGLILVIQGIVKWHRSRDAVATTQPIVRIAGVSDATAGSDASTSRHLALLGVLIAYAVLLPIAGYAISTVAALIALFRIMGVRGWLRVVLWSIGTAAVFYVGFVVVADLPLPTGLLKIG